MPKTMFILFDGRAKCGDADEASVMECCDTEQEARESGATTWAGYDAIWYECPLIGEKEVGPGEPRWDLPPAMFNAPTTKNAKKRQLGRAPLTGDAKREKRRRYRARKAERKRLERSQAKAE